MKKFGINKRKFKNKKLKSEEKKLFIKNRAEFIQQVNSKVYEILKNRLTIFIILIILLFILLEIILSGYRKENIITEHSINYSNIIESLDIHEIFKKEEELNLFLKNKTDYYYTKRTKMLDKGRWKYDESNLTTFQDKLNYLLIHESPECKSKLADKIGLHEYSKIIFGKDICVPILKIYNNSNEINLDELPDKFVLKCNHGWAMNLFCKDKSKFNFERAKELLNQWMNTNFGFENGELQYLFIKRKIFASPYLGDNIIDYKIFCFNGKPKYIVVEKLLNKNTHTFLYNYYDLNWTLTNIEHGLPGYTRNPDVKIEKPKYLDLMIDYAKKLSKDFVFVRVDLYEINDIVYLSELTFTPSNINMPFKDQQQRIELGNLLDISKIKPYFFNN